MEKFAKIFESKQTQIVVMLDTNDEGNPAVVFYFIPEGLGVCSSAMGFQDTDEGWEQAEKAFDSVNEAKAVEIVENLLQEFKQAGFTSH